MLAVLFLDDCSWGCDSLGEFLFCLGEDWWVAEEIRHCPLQGGGGAVGAPDE